MTDDHRTPGAAGDDFQAAFVSGDTDGDGALDAGETWLFQSSSELAVSGLHTNIGRVRGTAGAITVGDDDDASYFGWVAGLRIEKATNAANPNAPTTVEDGDTAPGQSLVVGTPVVWTYRVFNDGNIALAVNLRDDAGTAANGDDFAPVYVSGDTDGDGAVDPGETWLFTSVGARAHLVTPGPYVNRATASSSTPDGGTVSDDDPSHHVGVVASVSIVKSVNGQDANTAPGVVAIVGTPLAFTYAVTNTGQVALTVFDLTDDGGVAGSIAFRPTGVLTAGGRNIGDADADGILDVGESWQYRATGTAVAGQYTNTAVVTTTFGTTVVKDTDIANVFGYQPSITITKAVNGQAADTMFTAVHVPAGTTVTWTYSVTNTTTGVPTPIALGGVAVTDDHGTPAIAGDDFTPPFVGGDTDGDGMLDVGEVWTYRATGQVPAGLYVIVATATGTVSGIKVSDTDPGYAFGDTEGGHRISIVKALNALDPLAPTSIEDANGAPIPELFTDGTVVYTYLVRTPGTTRLRVDKVTGVVDDAATPGNASDDFHPAYVSGDVNSDGFLDPGEVWLFRSATFGVREGLNVNTAIVTGTDVLTGQTATAQDVAMYRGEICIEGNTPEFWKANVDTQGAVAWPRTSDGTLVFDPTQPTSSLFSGLSPTYANRTLTATIGLNGDGLNALLRQAVAAVLNAVHPHVAYPLTAAQVIALVNDAIASGNNATIKHLANRLERYNEVGSNLDAAA